MIKETMNIHTHKLILRICAIMSINSKQVAR